MWDAGDGGGGTVGVVLGVWIGVVGHLGGLSLIEVMILVNPWGVGMGGIAFCCNSSSGFAESSNHITDLLPQPIHPRLPLPINPHHLLHSRLKIHPHPLFHNLHHHPLINPHFTPPMPHQPLLDLLDTFHLPHKHPTHLGSQLFQ